MSEEKRLRILYAGDKCFIGEASLGLLRSAGHQVLRAADRYVAWDILSEEMDHIDVVITDHLMPGFTGVELVTLLRQTTYRGRIFVCSSVLRPEEVDFYRAHGVNRLISGGVAPDALLRQFEKPHSIANG